MQFFSTSQSFFFNMICFLGFFFGYNLDLFIFLFCFLSGCVRQLFDVELIFFSVFEV